MSGIQYLEQLVQMTQQLLTTLNQEELSVDAIHQMMERRAACIKNLERTGDSLHKKHLSAPDRMQLEALFNTFDELEKKLRNAFAEKLSQQQSSLEETTRSKQAVKSYRKSSEKPDISFY